MNIGIRSLGVVALMTASGGAYADGHISVDINPFGWGAPPPVVYESPRNYAPPPVVYNGRGHWGGDRPDARGRDNNDRGRSEHHDDGDRRR